MIDDGAKVDVGSIPFLLFFGNFDRSHRKRALFSRERARMSYSVVILDIGLHLNRFASHHRNLTLISRAVGHVSVTNCSSI